ncbi:hypothetical protein V0M98_36395 (plasmid) [Pseudomonas silesiensis]|uniref:hypothetical protein n=1 Tax=Pseudomonas silesiensis TaxID=1853130 RepID=UPI0030D37C89
MTQPVEFADLKWSTVLPTESGHYFVANLYGHFNAMYEWINVTDGVASSMDSDFDRYVYEQEDCNQFFGPLVIPEPPVFPQPEETQAANPIDGEESNV